MISIHELYELLAIPGAPGSEEGVAGYLRERLEEHGLQAHRDAIGNLWTSVGSGSPRLLLLAHTDEVGFIVSAIDDLGRLGVWALGGWDARLLPGTPVRVYSHRGPVDGVIACEHSESERSTCRNGDSRGKPLWVDVGAQSRDEALAMGIELLQPILFQRQVEALASGLLTARALDNRAGCYLLLQVAVQLLETAPGPGSVTLSWTAQEEVGFRGPLALRRSLGFNPDAVIAVDAFPCNRHPRAAVDRSMVQLGQGPVLRLADNAGIGSLQLAGTVRRAAHMLQVPLQEAFAHGNTQASVFPGSRAVALDFATAYIHSQAETVDARDLDGLGRLLVHVAGIRAGELAA